MNQTVTRLYPTAADAERVARLLGEAGLGKREISVTPADGGTTKVTIQSPFGWTTVLIGIMDREGALPEGRDNFREYEAPLIGGDLFSESFGIPTLGGRGDQFSYSFGLGTLTKHSAPTGSGLLVQQGSGGYKGFLGLPLLSRSSGSYKGFLGLPLLTQPKTGRKTGFLGLPLLAGGRAR
jgi:hypothetical protein